MIECPFRSKLRKYFVTLRKKKKKKASQGIYEASKCVFCSALSWQFSNQHRCARNVVYIFNLFK